MSQVDQEPTGPFVGAAFLCEQILTDEGGVVSAIRIVDRITHSLSGPDIPSEMPPIRVPIKGLVLLKDGAARGRHEVVFRIEHPSGVRQEIGQRSVVFEGGGHGSTIRLELILDLNSEGLYWIDVLLGTRLLTRIPLEVRYDPTRIPQPG